MLWILDRWIIIITIDNNEFSQGQGQQQEVKVFDEEKLRQYLLIIAQDESGGFKDKPETS